jgi:hypothetical protein
VTKPGRPRKWTDAGMLQALRLYAERLGRTPIRREVGPSVGCPHATSYITRFGSWQRAVKRAGLTPRAQGGNLRRPNLFAPKAPPAPDIRSYWLTREPALEATTPTWVHPYAKRSA